ncbi:MAG: rhodanese-like domain-containing protein, partial [Bacteroidia bacterium]
ADNGREEEVAIRMARIGFDNTLGYLEGGINAWVKENNNLETIESINAQGLSKLTDSKILDVRKESEYNSQHVRNAINTPLDYYEDQLASIDTEQTYYVQCAGGYRSVIFTSLFRSKGYENLINVTGGFDALQASNLFEITEYVCPTTML